MVKTYNTPAKKRNKAKHDDVNNYFKNTIKAVK